MIASVCGITIAEAAPCRTRAATSHQSPGAAAASADVSATATSPRASSRRRPYRSPRRPAGISPAANVTAKPASTSATSPRSAPRSGPSRGAVTLPMLNVYVAPNAATRTGHVRCMTPTLRPWRAALQSAVMLVLGPPPWPGPAVACSLPWRTYVLVSSAPTCGPGVTGSRPRTWACPVAVAGAGSRGCAVRRSRFSRTSGPPGTRGSNRDATYNRVSRC